MQEEEIHDGEGVVRKSFTKQTRRGKVLRVLKEHYLRDDLAVPSELAQHASEIRKRHQRVRVLAPHRLSR